MILGKVELLVMAILLSKNIAQCDGRARRDDRAAVGWAWTGRNLILDEALIRGHNFTLVKKQSRLDVRKFLFSQMTINVWNK